MELGFWRCELKLARVWTIARDVATGGSSACNVVLAQLADDDGILGVGEAAPIERYNENVDTVQQFLSQVDASKLSFDDIAGSMTYLDTGYRRARQQRRQMRHQHCAVRRSRFEASHSGLRFCWIGFSRRRARDFVQHRD
jgi:hypothetical protein